MNFQSNKSLLPGSAGERVEEQKEQQPAPTLYCPRCEKAVEAALVCGDCGAVICRECGTPLEAADELTMG